jgi:hypothetical protein
VPGGHERLALHHTPFRIGSVHWAFIWVFGRDVGSIRAPWPKPNLVRVQVRSRSARMRIYPKSPMLPRLLTVIGTALRFVAAVACLALLCSCGGRHVRLVNPDATPGSRYTCWGNVGCSTATTDVSSELDPSETTVVNLPHECAGRIQQIVVLDAGSSKPEVHVTCASRERAGQRPPDRPFAE